VENPDHFIFSSSCNVHCFWVSAKRKEIQDEGRRVSSQQRGAPEIPETESLAAEILMCQWPVYRDCRREKTHSGCNKVICWEAGLESGLARII
jgi:hypothetical protein